ncbi:unnamed protein product, partial [Tetraodon nigroviridis]
VFFSVGFLWVRVKGRRAALKEAPVLVVAPHSSFFDMLVLCPTQLATVVSRSENSNLPVIGGKGPRGRNGKKPSISVKKLEMNRASRPLGLSLLALLEFNQSVLVSRKDPESRKKAAAQLNERLTSDGYWPQMLMFPEGTTTNGAALIKFKPGAFLAGVPVQPVLLRYPNRLMRNWAAVLFVQAGVFAYCEDSVRWTYKGTTWLESLWHTTSQLYTNMTIEFLPVYEPSVEERSNPGLYADNVQKLMARAPGNPSYGVRDGGPRSRPQAGWALSPPGLSCQGNTFAFAQRWVRLGPLACAQIPLHPPTLVLLSPSTVEAALGRMIDRCRSGPAKVRAEDLISLLGLTDKRAAATVCSLYSKVCSPQQIWNVLPVFVPQFFDKEGRGSLSAGDLSDLMGALLGVPQNSVAELYAEASNHGCLTEGKSRQSSGCVNCSVTTFCQPSALPTSEHLLRALTSHPTYQRVLNEYLQPEETATLLGNGEAVNNNGSTSLRYKKIR